MWSPAYRTLSNSLTTSLRVPACERNTETINRIIVTPYTDRPGCHAALWRHITISTARPLAAQPESVRAILIRERLRVHNAIIQLNHTILEALDGLQIHGHLSMTPR